MRKRVTRVLTIVFPLALLIALPVLLSRRDEPQVQARLIALADREFRREEWHEQE